MQNRGLSLNVHFGCLANGGDAIASAPSCAAVTRGPTLRYYCQGPHAWMVIATKT